MRTLTLSRTVTSLTFKFLRDNADIIWKWSQRFLIAITLGRNWGSFRSRGDSPLSPQRPEGLLARGPYPTAGLPPPTWGAWQRGGGCLTHGPITWRVPRKTLCVKVHGRTPRDIWEGKKERGMLQVAAGGEGWQSCPHPRTSSCQPAFRFFPRLPANHQIPRQVHPEGAQGLNLSA